MIQDKKAINLQAGEPGIHGVAVREMDTDTGPADYMLFIQGKACGVIEAKREGTNLGDVVQQCRRYALSDTKHIKRCGEKGFSLRFTCEATNHETRFTDWLDPLARTHNIFHFHQPNLNLSKVRGIPLPLPSIREQKQNVNEVEGKLGAIEKPQNQIEILRVDRLKQSVLKSAIGGKFINLNY